MDTQIGGKMINEYGTVFRESMKKAMSEPSVCHCPNCTARRAAEEARYQILANRSIKYGSWFCGVAVAVIVIAEVIFHAWAVFHG